ncbi:hypothetical protein I4F81_000464 [Pyropia yezoensis]|uniref:Uncharacterized protein n=1 Tax=Pyropia yezoensis TaxID=2788 RepID=A0ACC3BIU4_PYRYE|nr:hypothetical protein I4F81_000464 [Neopyropia yezoensis]
MDLYDEAIMPATVVSDTAGGLDGLSGLWTPLPLPDRDALRGVDQAALLPPGAGGDVTSAADATGLPSDVLLRALSEAARQVAAHVDPALTSGGLGAPFEPAASQLLAVDFDVDAPQASPLPSAAADAGGPPFGAGGSAAWAAEDVADDVPAAEPPEAADRRKAAARAASEKSRRRRRDSLAVLTRHFEALPAHRRSEANKVIDAAVADAGTNAEAVWDAAAPLPPNSRAGVAAIVELVAKLETLSNAVKLLGNQRSSYVVAKRLAAKRRALAIVVGAGLAGCLTAVALGRRGWTVTLLEYRDDPRGDGVGSGTATAGGGGPAGRSINLALSTRGLTALAAVAGLGEADLGGVVPMHGRALHPRDGGGRVTLQPYGQPGEALRSVGRGTLNAVLLDAAGRTGGVTTVFGAKVVAVDVDAPSVTALLATVLPAYSAARVPSGHTIADLALDHYDEMAAKTASPAFLALRRARLAVQAALPRGLYTPLYSLVTFSNVPYADAVARAARDDALAAAVAGRARPRCRRGHAGK